MSCGTNAATCTVSGTTVTIATCNTGYYLLAVACASCATTVASGTTATAPGGIVGCATCTATGVVTGTAYVVTCSSCITGYAFVTTAVPTGTADVTVPYCVAYSTSTVTFPTVTGNSYFATTVTIDNTNALLPVVGSSTAAVYVAYTGAATASYFCPDKSILAAAASVCTALGSFTNTG